jgi:hypothetical protein
MAAACSLINVLHSQVINREWRAFYWRASALLVVAEADRDELRFLLKKSRLYSHDKEFLSVKCSLCLGSVYNYKIYYIFMHFIFTVSSILTL